MTLLELEDVSLKRGERIVLDRVSGAVAAGEVVGLLGPNGAGKTTLIRAALGLLRTAGTARLGVIPVARLSPRERALRAAYVPQDRLVAWPVTVEVVVGLGRIPYRTPAPVDAAAVTAALGAMELLSLRRRRVTELSGGERARVLIARALAQGAPLVVADEPTAGLDPAHALGLMARFRALSREGKGVLVSLHDLGLAARWCDRLILLDAGRAVAEGPPEEVLTPERLAAVYGITAFAGADASGPILQPTGLAGAEARGAQDGMVNGEAPPI